MAKYEDQAKFQRDLLILQTNIQAEETTVKKLKNNANTLKNELAKLRVQEKELRLQCSSLRGKVGQLKISHKGYHAEDKKNDEAIEELENSSDQSIKKWIEACGTARQVGIRVLKKLLSRKKAKLLGIERVGSSQGAMNLDSAAPTNAASGGVMGDFEARRQTFEIKRAEVHLQHTHDNTEASGTLFKARHAHESSKPVGNLFDQTPVSGDFAAPVSKDMREKVSSHGKLLKNIQAFGGISLDVENVVNNSHTIDEDMDGVKLSPIHHTHDSAESAGNLFEKTPIATYYEVPEILFEKSRQSQLLKVKAGNPFDRTPIAGRFKARSSQDMPEKAAFHRESSKNAKSANDSYMEVELTLNISLTLNNKRSKLNLKHYFKLYFTSHQSLSSASGQPICIPNLRYL
eukprot:1375731-Amorphochlora_amoeboformis.AAC.1